MNIVVAKNFPRYKDIYFALLCGKKTQYFYFGETIGKRSDDFFSTETSQALTWAMVIYIVLFRRDENLILGSWDSPKAIALALAARQFSLLIEGTTQLRTGIKAKLKRYLITKSRFVLATSTDTFNAITILCPTTDIEYVPTVGFPLDVKPLAKSERIRFVYIGRLAIEKNLRQTIDFVDRFHKTTQAKHVDLDIIGDGIFDLDLSTMQTSVAVNLKGPIDNNKLPIVLGRYDVLILLSTYEPWGLVVDEALKAGVIPVISSAVGARELKVLYPEFQTINIVSDIATFNFHSIHSQIMDFKEVQSSKNSLSNTYIKHENIIRGRLIAIGKARFY